MQLPVTGGDNDQGQLPLNRIHETNIDCRPVVLFAHHSLNMAKRGWFLIATKRNALTPTPVRTDSPSV